MHIEGENQTKIDVNSMIFVLNKIQNFKDYALIKSVVWDERYSIFKEQVSELRLEQYQ